MARRRGDMWQADAIVNGRRMRPQFKTEKEALAFEKDPYTAKEIEKDKNLVSLMFRAWSRKHYTGALVGDKDGWRITDELIKYFGPTKMVEDIRYKDIEAFKVHLRVVVGNASNTVNTKITILSALLREGVKDGILSAMPIIEWNAPVVGRMRVLTAEEEETLMGHLPEIHRAYAQFLAGTGARGSEPLRMRWEDVDFEKGTATFWRTKTKVPRTVPLTAVALEALKYTQSLHWATPFEKIVYSTFTLNWKNAKVKMGLEAFDDLTPYAMRHTAATNLSKAGVSTIHIQKWMGHNSLKTTLNYVHLDVTDLESARDAIEASKKVKSIQKTLCHSVPNGAKLSLTKGLKRPLKKA